MNSKNRSYCNFSTVKQNWLLYTLLFVTYIYTVFFTYIHNRNFEGYILGDWLINYQDGGYKRRGLSGSFFFLLQDITGFSLPILVYVFQFLLITFFFYTFYIIIKNKRITLLFLSLMLSSVGFVGLLNSVDYVGKKEFILFAIFSYYIYHIDRKKLTANKEIGVCVLLFIAMFFHEIVLFYIPYFLIAKYLNESPVINWKGYLKYVLVVFIPAIAIVFFGKNINEGQSLEILQERGVTFTKGIFFWNVNEKEILIERFNNFGIYFIGFLLSFLHVAFYIKKTFQKYFLIIFLLTAAFLYSLPLFYVGLDWGRWLYIHMMMIILLTAGQLYNKNERSTTLHRSSTYLVIFIILFSLIYRIELSGLFTFEGLFYRIFIAPVKLLNKIL
jgi:hypothetical protein